jgi:serine/threonine-protein kinase
VTLGTPYYLSPEQVAGKKAVDFRTDLWAMAVIACECMTGVRPFDGSTFGELLLNICARPIAAPSSQGFVLPGFDEWFAKATNRDAEQRFASAQDLASTLKAIVDGSGAQGLVAAPAAPVPSSGNPGAAGYAAASTGGPMMSTPGNVTGQPHTSPSVSSINTAQALQAALPRPSPLPWILLVAVLLVSAVGATFLLMRGKSAAPAPESAASVAALAAAPSSNADVKLAPAPEASAVSGATAPGNSARHAGPAGHEPHHEASPGEPASAGEPTSPGEPAAATRQAAEAHAAVNPPPGPAAGPASTKAQRCFSDPFSGQVRLVGSGPSTGASTFACKQDPFTGTYKKL